MKIIRWAACALIATWVATTGAGALQDKPGGQGFSFRTGVELINVTATVTDDQGRFVSGLTAADFEVYEDGKLQTVQQFDSERVPVSLGIALDTSGSMVGEKIAAAQAAVNRFLYDLLGQNDEAFLYRFDAKPVLLHGWTEDLRMLGRVLGNVRPNGGTAMYDAVAVSVPLAQSGSRRKKALVLISDGNDTSSQTGLDELRQLIRETEVLVYAIGIDASGREGSYTAPYSAPLPPAGSSSSTSSGGSSSAPPKTQAKPSPSPFPGRTAPARTTPPPPTTASDVDIGILVVGVIVIEPAVERGELAAASIRAERSSERRRAAQHHRRQRRPHGDHRLRARSRSGDGGHRERAQPAVFPRLQLVAAEGRPLAHD